MDLSLILPTLNERDNLAPLLDRLARELHGCDYEIILVDDDSPDRTWEEAERLRARHPRLRVIRRLGDKGLSSAVVRGFREAPELYRFLVADPRFEQTVETPRGAVFRVRRNPRSS